MFRHKEDRIPIALFVAYFGLDLMVFFTVEPLWFVVSWMFLGILPKAFISAWNHHHQHEPTFKYTTANRLLELIYGFQTGVLSKAWVLHHVLGHHLNYLDQNLDESRWKRKNGKPMGQIEYSLLVVLTAYPRVFRVGRRFPRHQKTFLHMLFVTMGLLTLVFYYNWVNALFVFALPMVISLYITAWHTYYHHSGLETDNDFEASYNITDKWFNVWSGNLGYHTAHHIRPGLHWSKLPKFHDKIQAHIPSWLYRPPPPPVCWLNPLPTVVKNMVGLVSKHRWGRQPWVSTQPGRHIERADQSVNQHEQMMLGAPKERLGLEVETEAELQLARRSRQGESQS